MADVKTLNKTTQNQPCKVDLKLLLGCLGSYFENRQIVYLALQLPFYFKFILLIYQSRFGVIAIVNMAQNMTRTKVKQENKSLLHAKEAESCCRLLQPESNKKLGSFGQADQNMLGLPR